MRGPGRATVLALFGGILLGHADLHERIMGVSEEIGRDPSNASLYLKRGELHRLHRDWERALADYRRATELDPRRMDILFLRGRMYYEAGGLKQAKADLDRFIAAAPAHREALLTRARVLARLGDGVNAAGDYTRAIAAAENPGPEYYLERAQALTSADPPRIEDALAGLDEGIARLGPLITLESYAITLELRREACDRALGRLERIARWMPREQFEQRRTEILEMAKAMPSR